MTPKYLLDSDVCIHAARRNNASLMEMVRAIRADGLAISVIAYGEVTEGVLYSGSPFRELATWRNFLSGVDIVDVTHAVADRWAGLRGYLRASGRIIGDNDLLIAATALEFGMRLVTRNGKHFARIPDLDLMVTDS